MHLSLMHFSLRPISITPVSVLPVSRKTASPHVVKAALLFALALLLPLAPADAQPSGTRLWTRQEVESPTGVTTPKVATDAKGNVFVTVAITHLGTDPNRPLVGTADFLTIKYAPDGQTLWTRHFRSAGDGDDIPAAIATDKHGNVIVAGTSFGSGTGDDFKVIKYDPNGGALWSRRYNSPFPVPAELGNYQPADDLVAMALDPNGNVLVTGISFNGQYATFYDDYDGNPLYNYALYDQLTVKLSASDGRRLYEYRDAPLTRKVKIASDSAGNAIVAGSQFDGYGSFNQRSGLWVGGGTGDDYGIYKLSSSGVKMWGLTYDGPAHADDSLSALAVGADGSVYVTGSVASHILEIVEEDGFEFYFAYDIATLKITPSGNIAWLQRYDETNDDFATDLGVDRAGNVFVTGSVYVLQSGSDGQGEWITLKYDGDGERQWRRHFIDLNGSSSGIALVPDGQGGVVVTGGVPEANYPSTDTKTIHYDLAGDALFSVRRAGTVSGTSGEVSLPSGLVLDGQGNVTVVSSVGTNNGQVPYSISTDARVVTTKYAL